MLRRLTPVSVWNIHVQPDWMESTVGPRGRIWFMIWIKVQFRDVSLCWIWWNCRNSSADVSLQRHELDVSGELVAAEPKNHRGYFKWRWSRGGVGGGELDGAFRCDSDSFLFSLLLCHSSSLALFFSRTHLTRPSLGNLKQTTMG